MTRDNRTELVERVRTHVATWDTDRIWASGFGMLVETDGRARAERRHHARAVLLAEALLEELRNGYGEGLILVKGLEAATLYPSPIMRHFRDLDLVTADPTRLWNLLIERGFRQKPDRRADIDHHHLPPLIQPGGQLAVEAHYRVNTPAWTQLDSNLLLTTALPSRTGIEGISRPRDDYHALIMALHFWKSGLTRQRDLLDALLFSSVSDRPVEEAAAELGLARVWNLTIRMARLHLLGEPDRMASALSSRAFQGRSRVTGHSRARFLAPYLVAGPMRVTRGHWAEFQLGRAARRSDTTFT